jgi:hypothetical protein
LAVTTFSMCILVPSPNAVVISTLVPSLWAYGRLSSGL